MDRFDDIPEQALAWFREGRGAALATVVETWGSAPRRVGSQLAISGAGEIAGSVSGGCVEGAVVAEALDAIERGTSATLTFGVSDDDAFAVGLGCGGTIRVMVEPLGSVLSEALMAELVAARAAQEPVAVISGGDRPAEITREGFEARFRQDLSGFEADGRFVTIHNPPLRLIVVGAVHIAQALVPMARIAGYDVVIVDPRESFASAARFPGERLIDDWPDEALAALGIDARTAVVVLSHDPKIDDPALMAALRSEAYYIGALGSTRSRDKRAVRLGLLGASAEEIGRIHGPVGLDIGAATPAEIAVSTLAEMIAVLRGKSA
ncbi:XdhC family protein [Roseovarius nubinhibens]|uniref:XdhC/CoxI family protein n=1 Tax=Roseovarius nubinhibens (strain ATCC BAA-591 / DSM 15170 / ISM) TaxID=89187 RepID=A3SPE7_ROSNI|nr:XdhC family protein [Roseovarius nubinhibens]EAP76337.1 XdhC/CoxI family protein [Roseovarius nubinhibens ISM]